MDDEGDGGEIMRREREGSPSHVVVPHERLSPEALRGVLVEFVTREGTDYGHEEFSLEEKLAAVHRQLERGEAQLVFDAKTETTHLVPLRRR